MIGHILKDCGKENQKEVNNTVYKPIQKASPIPPKPSSKATVPNVESNDDNANAREKINPDAIVENDEEQQTAKEQPGLESSADNANVREKLISDAIVENAEELQVAKEQQAANVEDPNLEDITVLTMNQVTEEQQAAKDKTINFLEDPLIDLSPFNNSPKPGYIQQIRWDDQNWKDMCDLQVLNKPAFQANLMKFTSRDDTAVLEESSSSDESSQSLPCLSIKRSGNCSFKSSVDINFGEQAFSASEPLDECQPNPSVLEQEQIEETPFIEVSKKRRSRDQGWGIRVSSRTHKPNPKYFH